MSFRQVLPLDLFRKMMCGVLAFFSIYAASAQATIVFQDDFNRVGTLNGSTPSTTPGGVWTAHSGFSTDGTKVSAAFDLFDFRGAAYVPLPVAITSGNIYTLSATTYRGLSSDDSAIMLFGFFDAAPSWNGGALVDEGHAIAIAPRNNRLAVGTALNGSFDGADLGVADGTNGTTFGVRLYETAPNTWSAVAVELSPTNQLLLGLNSPTPISLDNIATIGMISGSLLPPYIDNLTLDVSTVALSGDYNDNGTIDAADYSVWRDALSAGATSLTNDPTPGTVDESDFTYWRDHFGETLGGGGGAGVAANTPVPEPATAVMLLVGIIALSTRR